MISSARFRWSAIAAQLAVGCASAPVQEARDAETVSVEGVAIESTPPAAPSAPDGVALTLTLEQREFDRKLAEMVEVELAVGDPGSYGEWGLERDDALLRHWMSGDGDDQARNRAHLPAVREAARRYLTLNPMEPAWLSEIGREGYCAAADDIERLVPLDDPSDAEILSAYRSRYCP